MRAVGSTHSWSPLYPDDGNFLLDGTGLNKLPPKYEKGIVLNKGKYNNNIKGATRTLNPIRCEYRLHTVL